MARIFLSYRRDDSAYVAATLNDKLQDRFGSDAVFFDVDAIPLGVDFRNYIADAVGRCDVLLVVIGDNWLGAGKEQAAGRLDDPADYVRIEIESALKRDIPVIPILVGEAPMPTESALPESIQAIAFRNAAEIRAGRDFRQHMDRLIQALEAMLEPTPPHAPSPAAETIAEDAPATEPTAPRKTEPGRQPAKRQPKSTQPSGESQVDPPALQRIRDALDGFTDPQVFLAGRIPTDKLTNALATYAKNVAPEDVLLLYDNTVLGGAKDGLLLTNDGLHFKGILFSKFIRYADVREVRINDYALISEVEVNGTGINVTMGDRKAVAKALADVIRHLGGV